MYVSHIAISWLHVHEDNSPKTLNDYKQDLKIIKQNCNTLPKKKKKKKKHRQSYQS